MRARLRWSLVVPVVSALGVAPVVARAQSAPAARPAQAPPAAGQSARAAVQCKDGTTSPSGRGACSRHGGVVQNPTSVPANAGAAPASGATATNAARAGSALAAGTPGPAAARAGAAQSAKPSGAQAATGAAGDTSAAGATAQCKDGTYWHAKGRRGACSRHGGVAKFLTT